MSDTYRICPIAEPTVAVLTDRSMQTYYCTEKQLHLLLAKLNDAAAYSSLPAFTMEQWKQAVYVLPCYLTILQLTHAVCQIRWFGEAADQWDEFAEEEDEDTVEEYRYMLNKALVEWHKVVKDKLLYPAHPKHYYKETWQWILLNITEYVRAKQMLKNESLSQGKRISAWRVYTAKKEDHWPALLLSLKKRNNWRNMHYD